MSEIKITRARVLDVRFPTSLGSIGSDAVNKDPDYSAAYCILETDAGLEGHGLTFTLGTDLRYSIAVSAPANFAACTYTPAVSNAYDPAIRYICVNPKGALASGAPAPNFTLQYKARIK